jgi:hypothetical protein
VKGTFPVSEAVDGGGLTCRAAGAEVSVG